MSVGSKAKAPPAPQIRLDFVPASDYTAEFHRLEMERVWPRVWQVACREEELPNVGDYVNYEIGNESILVVRSAPDKIRAFYNVCPHRGRRLVDSNCSDGHSACGNKQRQAPPALGNLPPIPSI